MELRKEEKSPAELKDPKENSRFQVVKLEERVAPSCNPAVFITPSGNLQILPHCQK